MVFHHFFASIFTIWYKVCMLVKRCETKDFYVIFRCINAITSTCIVCENISTGCTSWVLKPPSSNIRKSRANVDGLQDTYTIRFGCRLIIALSNASSQPCRGGSTVITSGRKPCALHHGIIFSACPTSNCSPLLCFHFAVSFVLSLAAGSTSTT